MEEQKMNRIKSSKAITLIALVVTIGVKIDIGHESVEML